MAHYFSSEASSSWCVFEGELVGQAARVSLWVHVLEPLAPRTVREAGKGGVPLVPLGDELPEILRANPRHLRRGVLLQLDDELLEGDPPRRREVLRGSGREVAPG